MTRASGKGSRNALAAIVAVALGGLVLRPAASIVAAAFTDADGHPSLERWSAFPQLVEPCLFTLGILAGSVALAVAIGLPLALVIATTDFPGRRIVAALLFLPVTLPPIVGALAVRALVYRNGIVPRLLESLGWGEAPYLDGWIGILAVHALTMYPLVYAFCLAALARFDRSLLEAARLHGAPFAATLWRAVLPTLRPALAASSALVAMTALASFTAPYYFDSGGSFLTLVIFELRELDPARSILGTFLVTLLALAVLFAFLRLEGRTAPLASRGTPRPLSRRSRGLRSLALTFGMSGVTAVFLLPQATIVLLSLVAPGGWRYDEAVPMRYSLTHFQSLLGRSEYTEPLLHSAVMAAVGVAFATVLGTITAWWCRRWRLRGGVAVEALAMLPFALPGTVLGLAYLGAYNVPQLGGWLPPLAQTIWILPLAYVARVLPLFHRGVGAALGGLDRSLEEAAATLGAGPGARLARVLLPGLLPAIAASALLAFLTLAGEFPASILLYVTDNQPVSVKIDTLFRHTRYGRPFAYATLLLVLQVLVLALATWVGTRKVSRRRPEP